MKLCWDDLNKLIITKHGLLRLGRNYYNIQECSVCGQEYLSDRFRHGSRCDNRKCRLAHLKTRPDKPNLPQVIPISPQPFATEPNKHRRGRPKGYHLPQQSRDKISKSLTGRKRKPISKLKSRVVLSGAELPQNAYRDRHADGSVMVDRRGFRYIYVGNGEYIREDRLRAEKLLGRILRSNEMMIKIAGSYVICSDSYGAWLRWKERNRNV